MSQYRSSGRPPHADYPPYEPPYSSTYQSYQPLPPLPPYLGPPPDQWRGDRYLPEQRSEQRFRGPYSDLRRQAPDDGRDQRNDFRPPQGDFNFRVERPAGIQDTPYDSYRPSGRENKSGGNARGDRDRDRKGNNRRSWNDRPGLNHRREGGPWRRGPQKAADRLLLHRKHDETAELFLEDTARRATYRAIEDLSDSDDAAMEISGESESETEEPSSKRARITKDTTDTEQSLPKWSNPDPYTALPPPDETHHKKVDVVHLIRKARIEAESRKPAISTEAAEFISCDFSDDEDSKAANGKSHPPNAPKGPRASTTTLPPRPTTTQQLPQKLDRKSGAQASTPSEGSGKHPKPKKQVDLTPSTTLGNRKRTFDDQIKLPHSLLKKASRMPVDGCVVSPWHVKKGEDPCPWATTDHSATPHMGVRLHKELVDFYEYVKPRDFEERVRQEMIDKLTALVKIKWRDAQVFPFGSFKSGLYLPTADMDIVICSQNFIHGGAPKFGLRKHLFQLRNYFEGRHVAYEDDIEVVIGAKVPLLKYCDSGTGLRVDISFEKLDGVDAIQTFLAWKAKYPVMPKLVTVIKHYLCMRGLNEPVNGGIGGFTVICLVVSLLDLMPQVQSRSMNPEQHLGELLMEFFDLYGNKFRYETIAIRMNPPGYVNKSEVSSIVYRNLDRLSIIDPNNPENDISGGSSNFVVIRRYFSQAYDTLRDRMTELAKGESKVDGYSTILAPLFAGDYSTFREQREYLECLDREHRTPRQLQNKSYWDNVSW